MKIILVTLVISWFFLTPVFAQPGPPPDPDAPITGIEILLGIGGIIGMKKLADARKKK